MDGISWKVEKDGNVAAMKAAQDQLTQCVGYDYTALIYEWEW